MTFEDILETVGGYGKYQQRLVWFFLVPASFNAAFLCMNQVFLMSSPTHWCHEPTVSSVEGMSFEDKLKLVSPSVHEPNTGSSHDSCHMYNLSFSDVLNELNTTGTNVSSYVADFSTNWTIIPCKFGWDYDQTLYRRTATSNWDLVCDFGHLPSLVYSLIAAGTVVGTPIYGTISDRFGRKTTCLIVFVLAVITAMFSVVIPNFAVFFLMKIVNGSLNPAVYQEPLVMLLEIVSPNMRARINSCACFTWTLGLASMPLVAWLTADWIYFSWVCTAIYIPFLLCFWLLPESPRWLISHEKIEDAKTLLQTMAEINGKDISKLDLTSMIKECSHIEKESSNATNVSPLEFLKRPTLFKRLLLMSMCWSADAMAYNGFHYNVGALYGNEFISFCLLAIVEIPSYLVSWYLMESKLGRRWSNVMFLSVSAVACFLPTTAPHDSKIFNTLASLVGKFGVSASIMIMFQQSAEIFPTPLRATGMSIAQTLANVMTICSPYIIYLNMYGSHIPFVVMGIVCLVASICALFVPETLQKNLPQTLEDGESFGKEDKFFALAKQN